jgi:hypothetical protein
VAKIIVQNLEGSILYPIVLTRENSLLKDKNSMNNVHGTALHYHNIAIPTHSILIELGEDKQNDDGF